MEKSRFLFCDFLYEKEGRTSNDGLKIHRKAVKNEQYFSGTHINSVKTWKRVESKVCSKGFWQQETWEFGECKKEKNGIIESMIRFHQLF